MNPKKRDLSLKSETAYGIIQREEKFEYLGDILTPNVNEKEALGDKVKNMEIAFKLCLIIYKSKLISFQAKPKHYYTVVRPECLHCEESLAPVEDSVIEKRQRKSLRKILGPNKISE